MSLAQDHSDRDQIKARAEVDFLNLFDAYGGRRRGKALYCPFHQDRTPSASIFKGRFYCFGCGLDHDVIGFVQKITGSDFKSTLASLADRYRVPLVTHALTQRERREYARRRTRAEREAAALVDWKASMLAALRETRDAHMGAYYRCLRFILTHSLNHSRAAAIADMCELYEERYQDLDYRIESLERAAYSQLLPIFRRRAA